jgi:hypothetical protein
VADPTLGDKFLVYLKDAGISTDPAHIISQTEALKIAAEFGGASGGGITYLANAYHNKTVANLTETMNGSWGASLSGALAGGQKTLQEAIPNLDWVGALFSYAAALLLVVAGLWLYTRGQPQKLTVVQG